MVGPGVRRPGQVQADQRPHGQAVGDQVLASVAGRLREMARAGDTVCRLGGDEFALLLRGISPSWDDSAFLARAARVIAAPISCRAATSGAVLPVTVEASFGFCRLDASGDVVDAEEALRIADARMYAQKAGR